MKLDTRIRRLEAKAQAQDGPVAELLRYVLAYGSHLPIVEEPQDSGVRSLDPIKTTTERTADLLRLLGYRESHIEACIR